MKFTELNLSDEILKGIEKAGFDECMPVQEKTFPHTFLGKDVYVQSQTGSGKSAAFIISIFQLLLNNEKFKGKKALIIAPTRELADQIATETQLLGHYLDFKIGVFFGGVGYGKQEKLLAQGVDIVIGTPGRLIDFNQSGKLDFRNIGILIIDEADRLFDMGFYQDIRRMVKKMPPATERQTMLFSATLDDRVKDLAGNYMNDPVEIELTPDHVTVDTISQKLYHVGTFEKINLLLGILKSENPGNAIVFTNTKHKAVEIARRLEVNGYQCEYLIGDLPQNKRLEVIDRIKKGELRFLIATDVAARGLHIDDLELVINYDLPEHSENYVHRIGRTARVGKTGKAISLACEHFVYGLEGIESLIEMKIPVEWPDDSLFVEDKSRGMHLRTDDDSRDGRGRGRDRDRKSSDRRPSDRRPSDGRSSDRRPSDGRPSDERTSLRGKRERDQDRKPAAAYNEKQKRGRDNKDRADKPMEQRARDTRIRDKKGPVPAPDFKRKDKKPAASASTVEDRLAYYNKKYGESFRVEGESFRVKKEGTPASPVKPVKKETFVKRIFTFFRKSEK